MGPDISLALLHFHSCQHSRFGCESPDSGCDFLSDIHFLNLEDFVTSNSTFELGWSHRIWAQTSTYLCLLLSNREKFPARNKLLSDRSLISDIPIIPLNWKMQGARKKLRLSIPKEGRKHSSIQSKACSMIRAPGEVSAKRCEGILMIFTWVAAVWSRLLGGKIATWP